MAAPVDAKRELDLIEKVEWRILSASSDETKLQGLLKVYLPPLLLKAGSEHASVRNKVISTCQTINKLIKSPGIVLPVGALLDQYKGTEQTLVRHFDLIYVQHSITKLDADEHRALAPKALHGISRGSPSSLSQLFSIALRMLPAVKIPSRGSKEDVDFRETMGLADPEDAKFVAEWLGKLLLLRMNTAGPAQSPGLSEADINFLTSGKPDTWNPAAGGLNLAETRIQVVNLLASGAFTDEERFIPAIYAAASSDYRISGVGDDLLKRSSVSLEDQPLVRKLFEAHSRLPAPYRIRILGILSKSEAATAFTDDILAAFRLNVTLQAESGDAMQIDGQPAAVKSSGLERNKLHRALFEFINWVARIGSGKTDYSKIGPPLVGLLREFVRDQGWPRPTRQSTDESTLRSRAYETIGILAKGAVMSDSERLTLTGWLFRSLSEDPTPDVVVNIDGALSSLTSLFKPPHSFSINTQLQSILLTYMTLKDDDGDAVRSSRHAVTKWANNCLLFSDVYARWIDVLAIAGRPDERSDVVEEGQKGLDPWTYYANDDKSRALPDWKEMVQMFFKDSIVPLNASSLWGDHQGMDVDDRGVFVNFSAPSLLAFPVAVDYCRRILFLTALKDFQVEPGWERRLGALVQSDLSSRLTIREYLSKFTHQEHALFRLMRAAFEGMIMEDARIAEPCARSFVEIASLSPRSILTHLASRSMELTPLIKSNKKELRMLGSRAFGILAAHPSNPTESVVSSKEALCNIARNLTTAVGSELNAVEGAFVALGHLVSRRIYYGADGSDSTATNLGEILPTLNTVSSKTTATQEALFEAYSQLWTAAIQTVPQNGEAGESLHSVLSKEFIDPLVTHAKKGNEKAITALGRLAISVPVTGETGGSVTDDTLGLILEKLYSLYEIRQAEVHFAVGEAIAAAVACWDAEVVRLTVDVQAEGAAYEIPKRGARLTVVLEKLLIDCKTTKPSLLKASGIWLFCVIQHCSHLEEVQSRLRECQVAFMRLLSARDELVQETASRGLALVYEKGDSDLKGELVRDLVSAFTGSGPQLKVDQETELFDAGALPTGDGKSVTSYKDIVSLANEVGDPSLVYKFMSLATNAATWSTRSAFGRFGLSNILSESEIDPKLYPKLYRYRFDPNQNVQRSMNDIWKALVKDQKTVMETHFDSIMKDLLKSILGKEWRVREASCAAISDLVSGRPFPKYEPYYKNIWTAALKVLDDVKATVRNAALHLCIALSTTLVRQLEESGSTTTAKAMMNEALPFLLSDKGIESSAEDVKVFSTITVMKIAKSGGDALKPYIPTMVPHLLNLLSTIEPEAINYHYQRAGEDNREKIDKLRSAMVSRSPIAEAIDNCLRSVDASVMKDFAPKLQESVKTALGMPTKIGCARVLSTLATRHTLSFAPYSPTFLTLLEKQTLDRNDEVSQNYARAAAYLLRIIPTPDAKTRFADRLVSLYLTSEDETRRQKVADAVLAVAKISPDHFAALETQLLPFAFLARHDTDEYVCKAAREVWDAHAGSTGLTVVRYLREIVALVEACLATAQWALKHAGALAVAAAVQGVVTAGETSGRPNADALAAVWPVYDRALALKTFEGKEKLLEPLPGFVKAARGLWEADAQLAGQVRKVVAREAKRNNDAYRPHAFACLWKVAAEREDLDMLGEIAEIVEPYLVVEEEDGDAMDVDDEPKGGKGVRGGLDLKAQTVWAAIEAVVRGYNRVKMKKDPVAVLREVVLALEAAAGGKGKALNAQSPCVARAELATIRRTFWYDCVREVLEEALGEVVVPGGGLEGKQEVVTWFFNTLDMATDEVGTEDQRLARAKAVKATIQLGKGIGLATNTERLSGMKAAVDTAVGRERSLEVQKAWRECLAVLK
ncbi:proteasome stabiliser-domain-containing protein [Chaetomium fimeti]|uniref:Proteasome stabiliser-domain-containing protein n=1 Tax=Chaetomium fimeti TaxID=1854472 RepID=A0AAE0HQC5_9PEZI|nr:proteasome stabiliser-domain-containing protein [Chaetomium fimeti]